MNEYKTTDFKNIYKYIELETLTFNTNNYNVTFKSDVVRYIYDITPEDFEKFKVFSEKLFQQFLHIIELEKNKGIYIASYQSGWEKSDAFNIEKIDTENGLLLTDDINVIKDIFQKSLMYKAFPIFVNISQNIAIIPTDHLDLFVITDKPFDKFIIDRNLFNIEKNC